MKKEKKDGLFDKLPFSKSTVMAARYESYIIAILLFLFVWFGKEVSSIVVLASLSWGGYRMCQNFYLWMAKNEHLMDKKLEYKKLDLDSSNIDDELRDLEHQDFNTYEG